MNWTLYLLPGILCAVLLCAKLRRVDILKEFSIGASQGLQTAVGLIPTLSLVMTAVGMLRASGALEAVTGLLAPAVSRLGIRQEVLPLMLLKPFSGSGSFALLEDIFTHYGADSFVGRVASVIAGSTETTFYTVAVYFGSIGVSRTRHTVPAAVAADITGFLLSGFFVRIFLQKA